MFDVPTCLLIKRIYIYIHKFNFRIKYFIQLLFQTERIYL